MYKKNVSGQFVHIQGVDATTGGIKTGVTWTMRRCIDGTFAAGGATITEDGTTGWYKVALAQADTNGNNIGFNFTGTGAVPQTVNIITTSLDPYDTVRFGITGIPNATPGAAGGLFIAGTNAATTITAAAGSTALTLTGGAASGATPAGHGLAVTGGAASTTGGGTSGRGVYALGGAGAATTNGASPGVRSEGGGTTTVTGGAGLHLVATGNLAGLDVDGAGSGDGIETTGGATGHGIDAMGGATSGNGITLAATNNGHGIRATAASNGAGLSLAGAGVGSGISSTGGATGAGATLAGGATSGDGLAITASGGHGITAAAAGTSKHGFVATGGTAGVSDGIKGAAGTGGVDIRGNITGNVTGNVSGSVGSVTVVTDKTGYSLANPAGVQKNVALNNFMFAMFSSTDHVTPATGLTITATRSIDGAAFASCANSASAVANGIYKINLATTDVNGDVITLRFTATGADDQLITIVTEP